MATWIEGSRLPRATLRQLLNRRAGSQTTAASCVRGRSSHAVRAVGRQGTARARARERPGLRAGPRRAYSNTGFLLVRRIVDALAAGGFAGALERELVGPLGLADAWLALSSTAWTHSFGLETSRRRRPARRARSLPPALGRTPDARLHGADQRRFWTALAAGELCDLGRLTESVPIGFDAPGFVRPSYGLGVMTDPGWPGGLLIGHGGGGPGYAAAAFAVVRDGSPHVAILLSGDEHEDVQATALLGCGRARTLRGVSGRFQALLTRRRDSRRAFHFRGPGRKEKT